MKKISSATIWFLVLILVIFSALSLFDSTGTLKEISVTEFEKYMQQKQVSAIQTSSDGTSVRGKLSDGTEFSVNILQSRYSQILKENPNPNMNEKYDPPATVPVW